MKLTLNRKKNNFFNINVVMLSMAFVSFFTNASVYNVSKYNSELLKKEIIINGTITYANNIKNCNDLKKADAYTIPCSYSKKSNKAILSIMPNVTNQLIGGHQRFKYNIYPEILIQNTFKVVDSYVVTPTSFLDRLFNNTPLKILIIEDTNGVKYEIPNFYYDFYKDYHKENINKKNTTVILVKQYCFAYDVDTDNQYDEVLKNLKDYGIKYKNVEKRYCYNMKRNGMVIVFDTEDDLKIFKSYQAKIGASLIKGF